MKAQIVQEIAFEGPIAYVHGGGRLIKRLLVKYDGNQVLLITHHQGRVFAHRTFLTDSRPLEVIGEVDIPAGLVQDADTAARAAETLDIHKETIEKLLT